MAFDPEEFKQRRAAREQQRQQAQKQQRTLLIKVGIAVAAVAVMAILALVLTRSSGQSQEPSPEATGQSVTETTMPAKTVIHLAAAGDLNVTEKVVASGGGSYDYTDTFLDVAHLLADADITAVNLEGTLTGSPYGADRSAPQELMTSLTRIGVDYVQLANSYSIYKGMEGLKSTVSGVRQAGMEPLGAYTSALEAKADKGYSIRNVKGIKIAFVAFTKGMDGMALPPGNEGCVNVLYTDYSTDYQTVDTEGISRVLDAAAKEKPDLTVALLHWGSEFNNTISESQKKICALMQEKGVDAIIGTHSHYVQKMGFEPNYNGMFVAYSLGDLIGDADRAGSEYSVILDLEITKDNQTGETAVTGYTYTPIFTMAEEDRPLRVLRITEAMAAYESGYLDKVNKTSYDAMAYALERIEARVAGK